MTIVAVVRIVSIGSLIAALALPALVYAFDKTGWIFCTSLMVIALVILSIGKYFASAKAPGKTDCEGRGN